MSNNYQKLHVLAFALACGITWGLGILLLGWLAACCGWAAPVVTLFSSGYIGYSASFLGGIIGGIWALVDGFIFGLIIALIYNGFCKCCKK